MNILTALFVCAAVGVVLVQSENGADRDGLRAVVLAALLPLLAVGLARQWGGIRYLLPAYPFFLLAAAAALVSGAKFVANRLGHWSRPLLTVGVLVGVVLAGVFRHHGVPASASAATISHGEPVDADLHQQPFRPDHRGAGLFVRAQRDEGDVVVAEDPLEQYWYAGNVHYWLRSYSDARAYLYETPGNQVRDIYVNSIHLREVSILDSLASQSNRVWVVTSGETEHNRGYYLDGPQQRRLDSLEAVHRPAHVARDSATRVYCLNC